MDTVRLTSAAELVAVLPYEIGFRPRRSVVLVGLRERRLGVVQRVDLTDQPEAICEISTLSVANLLREGCQGAIVVGYEDRAGESEALRVALVGTVVDAGLDLVDEVVVRDGRLRRPGERLGVTSGSRTGDRSHGFPCRKRRGLTPPSRPGGSGVPWGHLS